MRLLILRCVIRALLPLALTLALTLVLALVLVVGLLIQDARADIIGWRIQARACQGPVLCADFPSSKSIWHGRYACQNRAENLQASAGDIPPKALGLPPGRYEFVVRCLPVEGLPRA